MGTRGRPEAGVIISFKGCRWLKSGHQWIFASDIEQKSEDLADGDLVIVADPKGRFQATAFYSSRSQIALRVVSTREGEATGEDFFRARIRAALARRAPLGSGPENAVRLVFSESDFLPGLIVDRYADCLVLQALTAGVERLLPVIVKTLAEECRPAGILSRGDAPGRRKEGLPETTTLLHGAVPERVRIVENGRTLWVDCHKGHKTGLYLDQSRNHAAAARLCRGRVLDAFCYQGAFTVQVADVAKSVDAVDSSPEAAQLFALNVEANGFKNVSFHAENVFDQLRRFEKEEKTFDAVILDPPSFARDRQSVDGAARGFKEINLRAMKLLAPGGRLLTFSCSYTVSKDLFLEVLREAAVDAHRQLAVVEDFFQAPDHPRLLAMPETSYLKGFCLERVD